MKKYFNKIAVVATILAISFAGISHASFTPVQIGGGGGGLAIGTTVSGGTATRVLYENLSTQLFDDANFTRNSSTFETHIAGLGDSSFNLENGLFGAFDGANMKYTPNADETAFVLAGSFIGSPSAAIGYNNTSTGILNEINSDSSGFHIRGGLVASQNGFEINSSGVSVVAAGSPVYTLPMDVGTTGFVLTTDGSGTAEWGNGALPLVLFAPTSASTVNLADNSYNAINPTGAILALTVNFPSSPADGDVVEVKYDKGVTTITYTGGTVLGGSTTAALGDYTKFTYSAANTSWY